ncbi:MAG: hypothetical protein ABUS47_01995 [Steroidobacter sp.]
MNSIVLLDTSIYLNVLNVPNFNQSRDRILTEFQQRIERRDHFLLPLAAVWETGNHISKLGDGQMRRRFAVLLANDVAKAFNGSVPYRTTHFPDRQEFLCWLKDFPDIVMRNKSVNKQREGTSLADLSIIKEWEQNCSRHSLSRVYIWSLDSDLAAYDRMPS